MTAYSLSEEGDGLAVVAEVGRAAPVPDARVGVVGAAFEVGARGVPLGLEAGVRGGVERGTAERVAEQRDGLDVGRSGPCRLGIGRPEREECDERGEREEHGAVAATRPEGETCGVRHVDQTWISE